MYKTERKDRKPSNFILFPYDFSSEILIFWTATSSTHPTVVDIMQKWWLLKRRKKVWKNWKIVYQEWSALFFLNICMFPICKTHFFLMWIITPPSVLAKKSASLLPASNMPRLINTLTRLKSRKYPPSLTQLFSLSALLWLSAKIFSF